MSKRAKHYEQAQAGHKKFQRFELIGRAEAIEENEERTVPIMFSSDEEVRMWYGREKLMHGNDNVDLSYFNARTSPFLVDHRAWSSEAQIGVIESARIDGKNGFAVVRFGKGERASEFYQDVLDGIRTSVSVGYEVRKWEIEDADRDDPLYIATEWVPREISLVTFPADDTVGVMRSERKDFIFELQTEEQEDDDMLSLRNEGASSPDEERTAPPEPEVTEQRAEGGNEGGNEGGSEGEETETQSTRTEVKENYGSDASLIFKMARDLKLPDERAMRAIQAEQSFADFATEVAQETTNARVNADGTVTVEEEARFEGTDVEPKDAQQFRITNLMADAVLETDKYGGFEREICMEEAGRRADAGMQVQGFAIPGSITGQATRYHQQRAMARILSHRDLNKRTTLTSGTDATAGHLIDSELRPENLIEWLYGEFAVSRAATWLMNAKGNIAIPKQDGRTVASWGAETAAATESNPTFQLLELSPKELKVITMFTKTFAIQTSVDAENLVRRDIMRGLGESLDSALIYGTGADGQIAGVETIDRIDTSPNAGRIQYSKADGIVYSDVLNAVEKIGVANAAGPNMEWIASWAFWKQAKGTAMLTNGSIPIWYENMMCDFMATATSQIKQGTRGTDANVDEAYLANWMYLLVAMWGGMDIVVDPFTLADRGMVRVVGFYRVDSDFAHDEAFVKLKRTP